MSRAASTLAQVKQSDREKIMPVEAFTEAQVFQPQQATIFWCPVRNIGDVRRVTPLKSIL
jgi:hypothetical protein